MLNVTYTGSNIIGMDSSLNCNVNSVMGLAGDVSLNWKKSDGPSNANLGQLMNSSLTDATINFAPLEYDSRGLYQCLFAFASSITNDNVSISRNYTLNIESE